MSVPEPGALALGRLPGLEEAVVAHTALTAGIGVYVFPYDVLSSKASGQDGAAGFADTGDNYLGVLRAITRDLQKGIAVKKAIAATLRRINETVTGVELDSHQNPQNAIVAHRLGDKALTLDLRKSRTVSVGFTPICSRCIKCRPSRRWCSRSQRTASTPARWNCWRTSSRLPLTQNRGQVLLTTHSPALLDHFSVGADSGCRACGISKHGSVLWPKSRKRRFKRNCCTLASF